MAETIGQRIKKIRDLVGISQSALAKRSSVSSRTIAYIETGSVYPRVDTLRKILQALGVDESKWGEYVAAKQGSGKGT